MSLRVLLITHYYPAHRGGVELVAGEIAARLTGDPDAPCAITWMAADCDPPPDLPGVVCKPQRAWNGLEKRGLPWPWWSATGWRALRTAVREHDIVHVHDYIYPAHVAAILLARRHAKPVVVTQHIGDIDYRSVVLRAVLKVVNRTFGRWLLGGATQVVFISTRVKALFESFTTFRQPALFWPNGVDTSLYHPATENPAALRVAHGLAIDKPVLLFVGRFVEKKGLHFLRQLAAARPEWQWCFAGWGPLDPRHWNLPNVRVFSGLSRAGLAPLYQLADALVLPSYGEGFPLVVQESLACGTPTIISEDTAAGGPALPGDIIPVAFDPAQSDTADWLQAIEAILASGRNAARRQQIVVQASTLWSWDRVATDYQRLFFTLK